jgi:mRNA interferase RelE/StbE
MMIHIIPNQVSFLQATTHYFMVTLFRQITLDPRHPGAVKLTSEDRLYRVRSGDYRVIYQVQDERLLILVVKVGHRREVYR